MPSRVPPFPEKGHARSAAVFEPGDDVSDQRAKLIGFEGFERFVDDLRVGLRARVMALIHDYSPSVRPRTLVTKHFPKVSVATRARTLECVDSASPAFSAAIIVY